MNRQPIRRVLLVVAIVSLVAIAGCNGLSGSSTPGNTTTDTSAGGTPTPADGSTPTPDVASDEDSDVTDSVDATNISENETDDSDQTTNGSDQTTDESDGDTDDSAPAGADINGTALTEGTAAVVEDAGSYTITSRLSQASQRSATVLNTTARGFRRPIGDSYDEPDRDRRVVPRKHHDGRLHGGQHVLPAPGQQQ